MIRSLKTNTTRVEGMKLLLRTISLSLFGSFFAILLRHVLDFFVIRTMNRVDKSRGKSRLTSWLWQFAICSTLRE